MPFEGEWQELTRKKEGQAGKWGKMHNWETGRWEAMCTAGLLDAEWRKGALKE